MRFETNVTEASVIYELRYSGFLLVVRDGSYNKKRMTTDEAYCWARLKVENTQQSNDVVTPEME